MKSRTIIILSVVAVLFLGVFGSAYYWYQSNYGGQPYYTKIVTNGTRVVQKDDAGAQDVKYSYNQMGYDKNGVGQKLEFNSFSDRPLKMNAYLKVVFNQKRHVVVSWEKVETSEVPKAAMDKLD